MITLITGAPGTGKSAALVALLVELAKTRTVYVSGIPDLAIPHEELPDPSKWPEVVPDGCIIVIDEVQRVWRPRGPGQKVPPDIAALETHRHRGLDFYVVTQAPRLMDSNIRGLVGRHVHLRDLGILGRWWYEWPECADNCATSWKNAPIKKRYRLPKSIFGSYKSATQHIKPIRSFPWMLVIMVLALLVTGVTAWRAYASISSKLNPPAKSQEAPKTLNDLKAGQHAQAEPVAAYDPSAFVPRVWSRPESAPAYDHLRVVTAMPLVAGAMCTSKKCVCVTQQGTNAGLSDGECRTWLKETPFNPYAGETVSGAARPVVAVKAEK
jgi:zona occludens toxin